MFARYVAIGDSTTEGMDDPRPDGTYRGWADRLAERLTQDNPNLLYANLAIRGRRTFQVREEQLEPALALQPDIATVVAGLNDLLRKRYDPDATAAHLEAMFVALRDQGATVMTFTLPDLGSVVPLARIVRPRVAAFNAAVREIAGRTRTIVLDLAATPVTSDPRLWSVDRLHANTTGHTRIAAGFCEALGLDGTDNSWADPFPPATRKPPHALVAAEVAWAKTYFTPWIVRRVRGRSSGDGREPKRPTLGPVALDEA
jgi:lysophospholipase L1-like esterase